MDKEEMLRERFDELLKKAAGDAPVILGKRFIEKDETPLRYFIVGDIPLTKDIMTGVPFSGSLNEVLIRSIDTLREKMGAEPNECYITYLVKAQPRGVLQEEKVRQDWLPLLQLEYAMTGCENVVCIGKMARQYANLIRMTPISVPVKQGIMERARKAWAILSKGE